jgi:hypothetical protein
LEVEGVRLQRLTSREVTELVTLDGITLDGTRFETPKSEEACISFVRTVNMHLWGLPMLAYRRESVLGMTRLTDTDPRSMSARLVAVYQSPEEAELPLAMYVRHAFWSFPLQRVYVRCPWLPELKPYRDLFLSTGFRQEGLLPKFHLANGARFDVAVLGLLREEFLQWCEAHQPRMLF